MTIFRESLKSSETSGILSLSGLFLLPQKDLDNSKIYWNKVLEIDPSNKVAQEALQSIQ